MGSTGRKRVYGVLVKWGKGLGLVCGKPSKENGRWWVAIWPFLRVMGGGLDFGMTGGVATLLCAPLFPPYLLFPHPRRLGRKMFGTFLEGEVRIPVPLRGSTIGRWLMWSISFKDCKKEGCIGMSGIRRVWTKSKDDKFTIKISLQSVGTGKARGISF